ncbi:MAG: hypothetical protein JSW67_15525 [Candidatus Latescibacterota bacterium]|nr:MAG: hypothetical protein JSW67_15525 [Candidatus Latescibacterota bacterium]
MRFITPGTIGLAALAVAVYARQRSRGKAKASDSESTRESRANAAQVGSVDAPGASVDASSAAAAGSGRSGAAATTVGSSEQGHARAARIDGATSTLTWSVRVPQDTPAEDHIFLCGDLPEVGAWAPAAIELECIEPGMYRCEVPVPAGAVLHYKFTRGSWDNVETTRDGKERPNRVITALLSQHVLAQVDAWADQV